ncbi:Lovastatin diketide synthase LovF 15 [Paramyrothecium foliicola]|nr:Lovastatin diketide synthase LovF 15 [Paramyrothecium foliicola]
MPVVTMTNMNGFDSPSHNVANGFAHTNGTNGHTNGHTNGASYTNGTNGHTNGHSHTNGANGFSQEDHANGANGVNGSSHINGTNEINGINGSSHTNGVNGANEVNGDKESSRNDITNDAASEPDINKKAVPVAICGMGLRLPGGSSTPQQFWDFLVNKGDARGPVPSSRYNVSAYHETSKRPTTVATEYGYFLDDEVKLSAMDTSRFSMSRVELEYADPQQRRLLEVVSEAFDDAGEANFRGKKIGCYFGNMNEDWGEMMNRDPLWHGPNKIDGYQDWMLANRISYEFGLNGPSVTVRTACSSALMGLSDACAAIQRGICEGAIVAGGNLVLAPGTTQSMTEKGILSPEGSCKSFSADADGYARGEAFTAVFLKPLDAAIRDGNPIRGVIRAAVANSDGKTQGITQPNSAAHEAMIRMAYEQAGITDFSKTAYFECHGTGTAVGDPIETGAVANVFGDSGIHITSVKPNVGHTEGSSGLVSLIKAVMSLENRTIPPNIKFNSPNPKIPFAERKLTVPVEPTPFPEDRHERVSVNSFGLGGSNAHVIVDSARSFNLPKTAVQDTDLELGPQLLLFSAGSAPSLKSMASNYEEWLAQDPTMTDKMKDLAYTLANRREHLAHRSFKVVGNTDIPASQGRKIPNQPVNLVMVFTGQGAQWPRMGRELLMRDDLVFQKTIRALDEHLQAIQDAPEWTIERELQKSAKTSRVQMAEFSQPLCTAVQIGLLDLLATVGVEPEAVVGHSSGELAAAYAAGALTAKEAIIGAYQRGQAAKLQNRKGAMAAVGLGWEDVEKFLNPPHVVVACENSPQSVTLSGDAEEVQAAVSRIRDAHPDVTARLLKVEKAYHSYHMREIGEDYRATIAPHLEGKQAKKPFFSSVTGTGLPEERTLDAKYWQQNLESPVLFSPAMAGILKHFKNPAFLEIGPHGALAGPARQVFSKASASPPYFSAMTRNEDCVNSYLAAIGKLFELNVPLDLEAIAPAGQTLPNLPRYPWNYEGEFWAESRMSAEWRHPQFPRHPLLGRRQLECTSLEPSFRNLLSIEDAPWLRDHVVQGIVVFPAAGYFAMAGEAVRQLSGVEDAYSLRQVRLSQALVLQEGVDTEVVTNLRPRGQAGAGNDQWWEFSIASYSNNAWTQHCIGQVSTPSAAKPTQAVDIESLPRKLDTFKVFHTLAKAGMQYGPAFQRLDKITAGTMQRTAFSSLTKDMNGDENKYHLHPTVIDAALQIGLVAARSGKLDPSNCAAMPTFLEEATIFRSASDSDMTVAAATDVQPGNGEIRGQFKVVSGGQVVLDMPQAAFTPIEQGEKEIVHHLPIMARVSWSPHIDFMDTAGLIKPVYDGERWTPLLNELGELCFIFFQRRIEAATELSQNPTIQNFAAWVGRQFQALDKNHQGHALDIEGIVNRAHEIGEKMATSPLAPCANCILEIGLHIDDLLSGSKNVVEVLQENELLTKLYTAANTFDRSAFMKSMAHARPSLRVLEVGAGTGQLTASLIKDLTLPIGKPLYFKYTLADNSSANFADMKTRFQDMDNIEYKVLDVSKDPAEQGFKGEENQYDLIVATNVVHATESLSGSLTNIRKLLAPGGRLLLQEINTESKWINCILGFLDDWWVGEHDGRPDEPYVGPERWEKELKAAGFGAPDLVMDSPAPHQLSAVMIARSEEDVSPVVNNNVVVLTHEYDGKAADELCRKLEGHGRTVSKLRFGEEMPQGKHDIIALLEEGSPFFEDIDEKRFKNLQSLLANIGESGLFWITRPSQIESRDPRYAQSVGAIRSIRHEDTIDFASCEVEDVISSLDEVIGAFDHFQKRREDEFFRPNYEYAIANGSINVPRIYPFTFADERLSARSTEERLALVVDKPSRRAAMHWELRRAKPLDGAQVEVEVFCTGMTSKDVSRVSGMSPYPAGGVGESASGRVSAIGPKVKGLSVGDRVICLGSGSFSSHMVTPEALVAKIPDSLSFEEAAMFPAAYAAGIAALHNVGNLQTDQTVLIHNATGDVGLAALHLATKSGATIYATVETDADIEFLVKTFNVPKTHIFSSTDSSFVKEVLRETDGNGVDLVLHSQTGNLMHATWKLVADFGKMVAIGAADMLSSDKLELDSSLGGRTFAGVDLDALVAKKPSVVKKLLQATVKFLKEGSIGPIAHRKVYEASAVRDAINHVQERKDTSKVILQIRGADGDLKVAKDSIQAADDDFKVDESASYLLAGGLGGIGTVIARHLVETGARRIVCLSRNPGSRPEDADTVRELESMGCEVVLVKGDMVNRDDVFRAVQQAPNLKGILHSPMLLQDEAFRNMKLEQWTKVIGPKVKGAWYLHEATQEAGIELDFFVFLSSMSGLTGQPGQANYAGANTFLDAFALWRNSNGLRASSIDIGAVADMGYAARDQTLLQRLLRNGYSGVTESEMIEAFRAAASYSIPRLDIDTTKAPFSHQNTFATGFGSDKSLSHPDSRLHWKKDVRMAVWHNISDSDVAEAGSGGDAFKSFIAGAKADPEVLQKPETAEYIALEVGKQLMNLLLRAEDDLDITVPVQQLGLDSLVGIELRNWWRQTLGFDISVLQLLGFGTLEELGKQAVKGLSPAMVA